MYATVCLQTLFSYTESVYEAWCEGRGRAINLIFIECSRSEGGEKTVTSTAVRVVLET